MNDADGRFYLSGDTIRVADGGRLDYEDRSFHTIRVRTIDQIGLTYEQNLVVNITDVNGDPTDIIVSPFPLTVDENSTDGTLVGTLDTIDPDPGDTHTYELVNSADGRFAVVGDQLIVADGAHIDYELKSNHIIRIRTTDSGTPGLTYEENFTIQVIDRPNGDPTDITLAPSVVDENKPNGTIIGTLSTTDPNPGDTHTYTLLDDDNGRFTIVGDLVVLADAPAVSCHNAVSHNIRVRTTDSLRMTFEKVLVIKGS